MYLLTFTSSSERMFSCSVSTGHRAAPRQGNGRCDAGYTTLAQGWPATATVTGQPWLSALASDHLTVTWVRSGLPNGVAWTSLTLSDQPMIVLPYHVGMVVKSSATMPSASW